MHQIKWLIFQSNNKTTPPINRESSRRNRDPLLRLALHPDIVYCGVKKELIVMFMELVTALWDDLWSQQIASSVHQKLPVQMSMMQMARHMFEYEEVRNAIQDFNEDLFFQIVNIIFK
ncbi:hypothetical protein TELCIR_17500 [Teladorsagia circumcincta]|uniref:Uncharacterized protein n=1 Tax=Teladorsagia circumcincta TaxID=45464 RepID=A0A2G9TSL2_TELCI|nr:hypothetical protein TELCIR_17500 [Teladorsagia circumcincta]